MNKQMCKIVLPLFMAMVLQSVSFASEEGVLNLSDFTIKSVGIGNSGPVQITGVVDKERVVASLKIEAFGKEYSLSQDELTKVPKGFYNGIQLSYEEGYKQLGGKTVYIILQMGFVSGVRSRVLITFTESGTIKIEPIDTGKSQG